MIDLENTISNLETNIRWIEDIPSHQFPGWGNVTMSMRDALEVLKEQEDEKKRIMKVIWDTLHEGLSIDTVADQDWVYERIRHRIEDT